MKEEMKIFTTILGRGGVFFSGVTLESLFERLVSFVGDVVETLVVLELRVFFGFFLISACSKKCKKVIKKKILNSMIEY